MPPSPQDIKKLRSLTSAGMLDCKKALDESGGDFEAAVDWLRKKGIAKAAAKSERTAQEGVIAVSVGGDAMVELNCETDFVAKNAEFLKGAANLAEAVAKAKPAGADIGDATGLPLGSGTVGDAIAALAAKMGENVQLGKVALPKGDHKAIYIHNQLASNVGKIGVVVATDVANGELAEQVAMHIAAFSPIAVAREDIDKQLADKEKEVIKAQLEGDKKPPEILEKIIEGRMSKWFKEVVLEEQGWVLDDKTTVGKVLDSAKLKVTGFTRLQVISG